jgi:hypothetical protein
MVMLVGMGAVLMFLNFVLVFFIRDEKSFSRFPGTIFVVMFIILIGYLLYLFTSTDGLSPRAYDPRGKPVQSTKLDLKIGKVKPETQAEVLAREEVEQEEEEGIRILKIQNICLLVNLLILQSLYAAIAAVIGMKVVPFMKRYYAGFIMLYILMIAMAGSAEYIITHHH